MFLVSPLVALKIDQVKSLRSRGVKCSVVTSSSGFKKDLLATLSSDSVILYTRSSSEIKVERCHVHRYMEIIPSLEMRDCVCVSVSPDRPNIFYEVRTHTDLDTDLLA